MMLRAIQGGRWTAMFRPRRRVAALASSLLAVWLCVWVIGEAFAAGMLLATLGVPAGARILEALGALGASVAPGLLARVAWIEPPGPQSGPLGLTFVATWLAIWTLAGIVAAYQVMRLLSSEDHVAWDGSGLEVFRRVGPFRRRRAWRAAQIEHVSLSRSDHALLVHTPRATHALTEWGSKAERAAVRDEIRRVLKSGVHTKAVGPLIPEGWTASPSGHEAMLLARDPAARRGQVAAAWLATVALGAAAVAAWQRGYLDVSLGLGEGAGTLAALVFLGACVAGSAWLTWGGMRVLVRQGEIEFRSGPLMGRGAETLKKPRLTVEHTTDEDGDDWFELQARTGDRRRTIYRRMNEVESILQLARWIAGRTGAPLDLGRGVAEYEQEHHTLAA